MEEHELAREERPGDWAAWMEATGGRAPVAPLRPASLTGGPSPASRTTDVAALPPPDAEAEAPAAPEPEIQPLHDDGAEAPRSARREATRQRILDAAREVFAERGVIGGTVEDICERAGFTRGAFYSNFGDKDDVVDALVEREHERLLGHLEASFAGIDRAVVDAGGDLAAVCTALVDQLLRSIPIDRQVSLVQTELEIHAIRRPDQAGRFVAINLAFRDRIARFLEDGMRTLGRELLVDRVHLTDAIVAIAESSVRRALLSGPDADPDAMASAVLPGLLLALSKPLDDAPAGHGDTARQPGRQAG
jgi:AcrR family transcriptional regulator